VGQLQQQGDVATLHGTTVVLTKRQDIPIVVGVLDVRVGDQMLTATEGREASE
jgi:hypothetical protein